MADALHNEIFLDYDDMTKDQRDVIVPEDTPLLEVELYSPDDFLKVVETLTRIGIILRDQKKCFQSCHVLTKKGKLYLMHFKELFRLDGKRADFTVEDIYRRNTIAKLLEEWELVKITNPEVIQGYIPTRKIGILPFAQKQNYEMIAKYQIGRQQRFRRD